MLKNKKAIYILIPLNIVIWWYFAATAFGSFDDSLPPFTLEVRSKTVSQVDTTNMDTFILSYKDPFLKTNPKHLRRTSEPRDHKKVPILPKIIEKAPSPDLRYGGMIRKSGAKQSTALVYWNGELKLVKNQERLGDLVVKSFNSDSLVAMRKSEILVFRK